MPDLSRTFAALSDTTRRAIVAQLADGDMPISDLAAPYAMSLTAVSKHVRVLSDAGLVRVTKRGRTRYCSLMATPMKDAAEWLDGYRAFWDGQFDSLSRYLDDLDKN
ncbi:MAG: metalloregulator ArsR/SmtB family transcription factor [Pseudomonadota bacterium]